MTRPSMPADYLHNHRQFGDLLRIVADNQKIAVALVEKDYWIMHSLHGLQQLGLSFELKGGTSLSKGHGIIHRFSEDIDIRIEPPAELQVATGRNHNKPGQVESRKAFYGYLARTISMDGVTSVTRDTAFDDVRYRSGGIRLAYKPVGASVPGLKDGILLEVGFDDVAPNTAKDISSWAYDFAADKVEILDNRAKAVACYDPGHTLVEKLQAISTKFRQQQDSGAFPANFMRHYYDVHCLLQQPDVQAFIGSEAYQAHKQKRFPAADNPDLSQNQAFILGDPVTREAFENAYAASRALYYRDQPTLGEILVAIATWAPRL